MRMRGFFSLMRMASAAYSKYCQEIMRQWGINTTALQAIMFFHTYPEYNTARDLCRMQGMKTGIASVAVEQLCREGLLERRVDESDRRLQRLYLTQRGKLLAVEGQEAELRFYNKLKGALTHKEFEEYFHLTMKLKNAIEEMGEE